MPPIPLSPFVAGGNNGRQEPEEKIQPGLLGMGKWIWLVVGATAVWFLWRRKK